LPAKKEHLKKFANMPQQAEDEEVCDKDFFHREYATSQKK